MPTLFRQPASDEEEWTPPDYAKPVQASSSEEWKPPDYATPVKKEVKKSTGGYIPEFLKPAKTIKPTGSLLPASMKPSTEPISYDESLKKPEQKGFFSSVLDALRSTGAGENARRSREGEKDKKPEDKGFFSSVTNTLRNALRGEESGRKDTSVVGIDQKKLDEIISKLPESMRQPPIRYRDYPKPGERIPTGEEDPARFFGSLAAPAAEFLTDPLNIAAMGAGAGLKAPKPPSGELPIRRSREIPYRMEEPPLIEVPEITTKPAATAEKFSQSVSEQTAPKVAAKTEEEQSALRQQAHKNAGIIDKTPGRTGEMSTDELYQIQDLPGRVKGIQQDERANIDLLKESIKKEGVKEPIILKKSPIEDTYSIEDGHHRLAAARELGLETVPVKIGAKGSRSLEITGGEYEPKKPFVNPFEKKTEKPLEQTFGEFGGVGHPDEPGYANKVLTRAGKGEPGLAVEPVEGLDNVNHVVYRNKEGEPIAAAMVVKDQSGKNLVQDLAADKSKGLLTGRAMKALGGKLEELGATESSGTMSADAENFLAKMKSREKPIARETPTSSHGPTEEYFHGQKYDLTLTGGDAQYAAKRSKGRAMREAAARKAEAARKASETEWKPPEYAKPVEEPKPVTTNASSESAASQEAINRQASMKAKGEQYVVYDRAGNARPLIGPEAVDYTPKKGETFGIQTERGFKTLEDKGGKIPSAASLADRTVARLQSIEDEALERIKQRGTFKGGRLTAGLPADDLGDFAVIGAAKIAKGVVKFADWSAEMIKDFGEAIKPHLQAIFKAAQSKHSELGLANLDKDIATEGSLRKLMNSLIENKGARVEQQELYRAERAKRFSQFRATGGEGIDWAKKALSTLKGEYEKVNPGEGLGLTRGESNSLFSTIKRSNISVPEQARAVESIFKLMNGESTLQPNEIDLLDKVFGKHLASVSGPGAAMPYDVAAGEAYKEAALSFRKAIAQKPDDFLTKLANFSSKTTRAVLGFHIPRTAVSFHGFNEAIRHTLFGPNFNPFKSAGRFGEASYYLTRPGKAQEFLDINLERLGKAIDEGGLKVSTGDIGSNTLFKGNNFLTKGLNALTSPKPLFEQVIPALKLKSYEGLLAQYEKSGMEHAQAAKLAGYATNNIYGGLNLQALERSPHTQKLFRIFALAPDWLETNVRLGKGMLKSIKNPTSAEGRVYMVGAANFLGAYTAMNVLNAINNDGRFSFQNEVGHELDVAIGKDSSGRVRYFRPFGTAMDMIRIPLEIAHAAVEGNLGKGFSDIRSRASEPIQFMTDMMTNTDYAGRALYDKTKYGKPIPPLEQGENILGSAAGHFLPVGAEAGINLAQGKVSPEQFAAQVLQLPMGYKMPYQKKGPLSFKHRKMKP